MTIAVASYLSGVNQEKVAVVRMGENSEITEISKIYYGVEKSKFRLFDVDYFLISRPLEMSYVLSDDYDYVVIDFGCEYDLYMEEIIRCNMKIVLGSVNLWRYGEYKNLCIKIKEIPGSDQWLHIVSGEKSDVTEHFRKTKLFGFERIYIPSPYIIENEQIEYFQRIL